MNPLQSGQWLFPSLSKRCFHVLKETELARPIERLEVRAAAAEWFGLRAAETQRRDSFTLGLSLS